MNLYNDIDALVSVMNIYLVNSKTKFIHIFPLR